MSHSNLIERLRRLRGPYLGDGINMGVTTHELIAALGGAPTEKPTEPAGGVIESSDRMDEKP